MTRNTKILLLGTGVTVAIGTLAYFVCKTVSSHKKVAGNEKQETDTLTDEVPVDVTISTKEFVERRKEALAKRNEEISNNEVTSSITELTEETELITEQE